MCMGVRIYVLTASGRLKPSLQKIKRCVRESVALINNFIPVLDVDIVVFDDPSNAIPELGIGGFTSDNHTVCIYLDPTHKKFKTIQGELLRTLAHELHHVARRREVGHGDNLFETLITEGLAEQFEAEVTKKKVSICAQALRDSEVKKFLKKAQKEFFKEKFSYNDWFFGSKARKIPRWTGYAIGYFLIKRYLEKNPKQKASSIYNVRGEKLLT